MLLQSAPSTSTKKDFATCPTISDLANGQKSKYSDPVAHGQIAFCQYKHTWGKVNFISLNYIYSSCTAKNSGKV